MSNAGDIQQPDHERFWFFSRPVVEGLNREELDPVRAAHYSIYNRAAYHAATLEFIGYVRPEDSEDDVTAAAKVRNVPLLLLDLPFPDAREEG